MACFLPPFIGFILPALTKRLLKNLPRQRVKIPLGPSAKLFYRSSYGTYNFIIVITGINFGIQGHTVNLETPIKIIPQLTFVPFIRYYKQKSAKYFFPYQTANTGEGYFTSDYDLSGLSSYKFGAAVRFSSVKANFFRQISLRYAHYYRNNGLFFNQVTSYFNMAGK